MNYQLQTQTAKKIVNALAEWSSLPVAKDSLDAFDVFAFGDGNEIECDAEGFSDRLNDLTDYLEGFYCNSDLTVVRVAQPDSDTMCVTVSGTVNIGGEDFTEETDFVFRIADDK